MPSLIYIVDDDASFRTAVERRLKLAGYEVEKHSSAQTLLDRLQGSGVPGCVLLDVRMPGLNGLELQSRLIELHLMLPVIFVTGYADIPTTVRAIRAGAEDLLIKPVSSEQLIGAIERALARHESVRCQRSKLDASLALLARLTPRERQVFDLIVRGKITKQVARELGTTERTVKAHRHEVMEKMRVHSLAELVSIAERLGLIDPNEKSGSSLL